PAIPLMFIRPSSSVLFPSTALFRSLDNWLETGSLAGLSRTEIAFHTPPTEAEMELRADRLVLALGDPPRPAALDLAAATLNTGGHRKSTRLNSSHVKSSYAVLGLKK